jgi:hypothetical protein
MLSLELDQIETLTGAANDKLRTYFALFGFPVDQAPTMTPAMVMAAIEAGKMLPGLERPVGASTLRTPPTAHNEPNGRGETAEVADLLTKPPRTLAEVDAEQAHHKADLDAETRRAQYREILLELQTMAVGNIMPTIDYWNANRPGHLPNAQGILLRWGLDGWGELANRAQLTYLGKGKRPPVLKRKGH